MALGATLSNILGLSRLDEHIIKEAKILMASVKTKKSQFTRVVGTEDGFSQGLLLGRIDLWIESTPVFTAINKSQLLALKELYLYIHIHIREYIDKLITKIIAEATHMKSIDLLTPLKKTQH